jgi:hypothetical protein
VVRGSAYSRIDRYYFYYFGRHIELPPPVGMTLDSEPL